MDNFSNVTYKIYNDNTWPQAQTLEVSDSSYNRVVMELFNTENMYSYTAITYNHNKHGGQIVPTVTNFSYYVLIVYIQGKGDSDLICM